ncbi:MAG: hypothetical protein LBB54_05725, partial [Cellulomonadaceae bacterium]|nr:hypothetical protein [Cellulomonadaceae bacterium]
GSPRPCLAVIGTAAPTALEQTCILLDTTGAVKVTVSPDDLANRLASTAATAVSTIADALNQGRDVALTIGPGQADSDRLLSGLTCIVGEAIASSSTQADLILTGGATARAVLDRLNITHMQVIAEVHPGAVVAAVTSEANPAQAADAAAQAATASARSQLIATRPGSHGDTHSLAAMRASLTHLRTTRRPHERHHHHA